MHSFFFNFEKNLHQLKSILCSLFIILFLVSCKEKNVTFNQTSIIDKKYTTLSKSNKTKYLDSVQNHIMLMKTDSIQIKLLFELAAEYYYLNNNKASFKVSNKIYKISESINDSLSMGRACYYMGDCYEVFQKDSAYYYYKESENIFRKINDDEKIAKALFNKAHLLFTEGNYIESEVEAIKSLQKLKGSNNFEMLYSCYYLLGSNHTELEEYNNAIHYFNLAQENILKDKGIDENTFYQYNASVVLAQSNIYDKTNNYDKSILNLKKIATKKLKDKYPHLYSTIIGNIAYSHMKKGDYEEAKKYYDIAIEMSKKSENTHSYLFKIINFGEYHLLTKDTARAKEIFEEALQLSKQLKSGNEELKTLNFLAVTNPKNALLYKNEYVRISDSIVKKQRASRDKFARIEFETSQVEDENKVLSYRNLVLLLITILSIIVFLFISYMRHREASKKEMQLLEQKRIADKELFNLTNEFQIKLVNAKQNEQNRISKELHDGIMNQIYGVRLNLGFLNQFDDADSKEKRLVLVKELQKIEAEIRTISHDLSSKNSFDNSDFTFLLQNLIKAKNSISSTEFSIQINDAIDWSAYSSLIKINLYRILQELFLNVNKYANATTCVLKINVIDGLLYVSVIDDGVGFVVSKITDGIGLKNIKDRTALINGKLTIMSAPNEGARFTFSIPIG